MPDAQGNPTPEEELEAQFAGGEGQEDEEAARIAAAEAATRAAEDAKPRVKIGEAEYDVAEVQSLLEFQDWAKQHQTEMNNFSAYLRGEADFNPKGEVVTPVEGEQEDPFAVVQDPKLRELLKSQRDELDQLRDVTTRQVTAASLDEANRAVNVAYDYMKSEYGLDEEGLQSLASATAASGILPGIRANEPDASEAAKKALENTYWATPEFRNKAIEAEVQRQYGHDLRKELAGSVGGSAGSLSRELPSDEEVAKMNVNERREAMANEIAASLRGTT